MLKIRVENVVASTQIAEALPLDRISVGLDGAEYEPEQFPGLIYRSREPKSALLLFSSGKVVCTGAKSVESVRDVIRGAATQLLDLDIQVETEPVVAVQNIVATCDLGSDLNLNTIAMSFGLEHVEYEPEQFPGLVYRMEDPKVVLLFFGSGKIVCTGAKSIKDVQRAVDSVVLELQDAGLLPKSGSEYSLPE